MRPIIRLQTYAILWAASCLVACTPSKEKDVERFVKDVGGSLPPKTVTVVDSHHPQDSVKGDFYLLSLEADPADIPKLETAFGFSLADGATHTLASKSSPSYPWIVKVTKKPKAGKVELTIDARQPW